MSTPVLHRPKGLLLQWHITNRCNLRCSHCYQETYGGGELGYDDLIGVLDQYKEMLANWRREAGARSAVRAHITVTGGEPFVRSDFPRLLRQFARDREWYSFAILSNGSYLDNAMVRELRRLRPRFVQVSIEGAEEVHDAIRGAGDFQRTVAALRRLIRFRIPTMISFTAHRRNYRDFPAVAQLGVRLGVTKVWSDRLIPSAARGHVSTRDCLSPEETQEFFSLMAEARMEARRRWFCRTEVSLHRSLQFLVGGEDAYHCTAGDTLLTIMPDGTVFPCRRMPIAVGNVRQQPLAEIYHTAPVLRELRDADRVSQGCERCTHNRRCRGGLKCLSYAITGDPFQRDLGCWLPSSEEPTISTCFDVGHV